jgi:hypothetical protein
MAGKICFIFLIDSEGIQKDRVINYTKHKNAAKIWSSSLTIITDF